MWKFSRHDKSFLVVALVLVGLIAGTSLAFALPGLRPAAGEVWGVVFFDKDGNGLRDADDSGVEGATVQLRDAATGGQAFSAETTTGVDGVYSFGGLLPGDYTVTVIAPDAYIATTASSASVTVTDGAVAHDFGQTLILYLTGSEFADLNGDGARAP